VLAAGVVLAIALSLYSLRQQRLLARRLARRPTAEPAPAAPSALQHVGVVRFNPYHDTGGDYSFAVALLDAAGAGVVISGLYHRDRCRVYAKPVSGWDSSYKLTDEEKDAIDRARG
jgi:hypothetical protein